MGTEATGPMARDGTEEAAASENEASLYEPNPKHKEPWQRGAKGSLCPKGADASALLAASVTLQFRYLCVSLCEHHW